MTATYRLCDHTADVAVEATGASLDEVFAALADGLAAAMCDDVPEGGPASDANGASSGSEGNEQTDGGERFSVTVTAESREALLFDYLDQLIYERDVRGVLPVDNEARVSESHGGAGPGAPDGDDGGAGPGAQDHGVDDAWRVEASARGVPLSAVDAREVKAVTYSEMRLERVDDGWEAYVVFDV